jgi:hypothetical protein
MNTVAFNSRTGRVHDFCCKDHADRAIRSGTWVKPVRDTYPYYDGAKKKAAGPTCQLPGCSLPVFTNPTSGRKLDYCGRSHAVEHRLMQDSVRHTSSSSVAAVAGGGTLFTTGLAIATPVGGFAQGSSSQSTASSSTTVKAGNTSNSVSKVHFSGFARPIPFTDSTTADTKPSARVGVATTTRPNSANGRITQSATTAAPTPAIPQPQCAICLAMNANIILIPCGHVCLCQEDADKLLTNKQLVECPICRQAIISTNQVFLNH